MRELKARLKLAWAAITFKPIMAAYFAGGGICGTTHVDTRNTEVPIGLIMSMRTAQIHMAEDLIRLDVHMNEVNHVAEKVMGIKNSKQYIKQLYKEANNG